MAPREYWVNVYRPDRSKSFGLPQTSGLMADIHQDTLHKRFAVVHVRLKPEGAPARYSSERNRQQWETMPEEMRQCPF